MAKYETAFKLKTVKSFLAKETGAKDEALHAQKGLRKMPILTPAQLRFYWGLDSSSAFSLEKVAKRYVNTKSEP